MRAWTAAVVAALMVAPEVSEARQRKGESYWTEARTVRAKRVSRERSVLSQVATRAMPAVVSITTTQTSSSGKSDDQTGLGSGFVIHPDGFILTSAHVIEDAKEIRVNLLTEDGFTEEYIATVVGQDKPTDFALLKIDSTRKLPVLPLGKGGDVDIADWVVVIGNPFGLGHSVSVGVVSFKGRTDVTPTGLEGYFDYIQTDAAINPGNSGGPVLDINGHVVAIANAVNVSGQGIGFAIPIDVAKSVIPHLIREGKVRRGWVGIQIQDLTPDTAAEFGSRTLHGVLVSEVTPGSPAAKAGLRVGDVITGVDNVPTDRAHALRWRVSNKGVGKKVRLKLHRGGKPVAVTLILAERPTVTTAENDVASPARPPIEETPLATPATPSAEPLQSGPSTVEPTRLDIGATFSDVTEESASSAGLSGAFGALVAAVEENGIGKAAGLATGDVVVKINRTEIASRQDLVRALESIPSGEWVRMFVRRSAETHALTFRKP